MRKLKRGDIVTCILFDGKEYTSIVEDIEICKEGTKYGRPVNSCDLDKHNNVVLDLEEHWCYKQQIKSIETR